MYSEFRPYNNCCVFSHPTRKKRVKIENIVCCAYVHMCVLFLFYFVAAKTLVKKMWIVSMLVVMLTLQIRYGDLYIYQK